MCAVISAFEDDDVDALGRQLAGGESRSEPATDENDGTALQACSHDTSSFS
jgi:hypothetical protein